MNKSNFLHIEKKKKKVSKLDEREQKRFKPENDLFSCLNEKKDFQKKVTKAQQKLLLFFQIKYLPVKAIEIRKTNRIKI